MTAPSGERLAILAHELRSPVAALAALAAAADEVVLVDDRRRLLELAIAAARDVDRLVSDPELLSLRYETVDVDELAAGFAGPGVDVRSGGGATVEGDPTRLRQAVANLVANGLRHGSHVTVDVSAADGSVRLEVADDGPGLTPELDPFERGVGMAGSTGYGLWLARAVAEAHGGTLDLVPGDGAGARFKLVLPLASVGR